MSVLIWIQTVCKGYQQTTKVADSKERVKRVWIQIRTNVMTARLSVGPDLGPNCLPRLSAEKKVASSKFYLQTFWTQIRLDKLLGLNSVPLIQKVLSTGHSKTIYIFTKYLHVANAHYVVQNTEILNEP